ncbi:hybrid sensor histidine kinase/response regulator [Salinarimonas soli]|uniref:histidine kinase n=1 Tax=Salinarimonas soli TaxID=1638099 RepID=A0A5B2VBS6_9HYPH|nr:hybrid sensor histidine kinase/response regulator [Salinarimonas soli]KAA2236208.1 response regulator [Salinarimonas soli]
MLPLVVFGLAAAENRDHLEHTAEIEARRVARVFAEHALKLFETDEQILRRVDTRIRGMSWDEVRASGEVTTFLRRVASETAHLRGAGLIDPAGRLAQLSEEEIPVLDLSDRDYVREAPAESPQSFVSSPIVGRISGESLFRLSRHTQEGPEGGVIFVAMDPRYLVEFYRTSTRPGDSVTMARADGTVLVRDPPVTTGTEVLSPGSGLMRSIAGAPQGVYRTTSELDRIERIHAYERVGPYPIYVSYGLNLTGVLSEWHWNLLAYGLVAALSSIGLVALSLVALRVAMRERRSFGRWQEEAQRREVAEAALRQAQKMEAVGQLTGGVAHDFNNLLTVIIGNLDMARRRMRTPDERVSRAIENALQGANRAASLVERLLVFSRRQPLAPRAVDLAALVSGMEDLLHRSLGENVALTVAIPPGLWPVATDPNQLETALVNLAVNARDAMPEGGRLAVTARNAETGGVPDLEPGPYVVIEVTDTGTGMPPEVVERIFEPFFTTKPIGQGTGLGLSQVYGLARQSGGTVIVDSRPGQGTAIRLLLPRADAEHRGADEPAEHPSVGGGRETILLVEDQEDVRRFAVETLRDFGYEVLEAGDAASGFALLERHGRIALLLTDIGLPGTSGRALAEQAARLRPDLPVILITGHAREESVPARVGLLRKPISSEGLARAVRGALDAPADAAAE